VRRDAAIWILLACVGALAVVALRRPELLAGPRGVAVISSAAMLAYVGSAGWVRFQTAPSRALRHAAIWLAVLLAIAAAYRVWRMLALGP
jgi:hypothetical protein